MPPAKASKSKKPAPPPEDPKKKAPVKEPTHPIFEKHPKNFAIGGDIQVRPPARTPPRLAACGSSERPRRPNPSA